MRSYEDAWPRALVCKSKAFAKGVIVLREAMGGGTPHQVHFLLVISRDLAEILKGFSYVTHASYI